MIPARVTGTVSGSVCHPAYRGRALLIVEPHTAAGAGAAFLALDLVGAGVGDDVLIGRPPGYARRALGLERAPVRSLVMGIVDAPGLAG
ncbi:MAG: EutN/CcmL family microcompartment protein [Gaiellales bacterium]